MKILSVSYFSRYFFCLKWSFVTNTVRTRSWEGGGGAVRSTRVRGGCCSGALVERESAVCSSAASRPATLPKLQTHKTSSFRACHSHCWNLFLKLKTGEDRETETHKRLRNFKRILGESAGPTYRNQGDDWIHVFSQIILNFLLSGKKCINLWGSQRPVIPARMGSHFGMIAQTPKSKRYAWNWNKRRFYGYPGAGTGFLWINARYRL